MRRLLVPLFAVLALAAWPAAASAAAPQNTSAPTIEGTPVVGATLTAGNGLWLNGPTSFKYQWLRCDAKGSACVQIGGATAKTYEVAKADDGHTLIVLVTASNRDGTTGPVNSKPSEVVTPATAPDNTTPPSIVGQAVVGATLVANPGTYGGGTPDKFAYQWQRCNAAGASCASISGAAGQSYGVRTADVGRTLRVRVTASNKYGSVTSTSAQTKVVSSTPPPPPVTTTIASSAPTTICCQTVKITGTVSTSAAGEQVTVLAREFGDIADFPVATVTSGSGGAWTATVTPQIQTRYTAQTAGGPGPSVTVNVHPRVGLGFQNNVFSTKVTGASSFAGKVVFFQKQTSSGGWQTLQKVVLDVQSSAKFTVQLPKGKSTVRAYISAVQAGEGFLDGESHTKNFTRK